MMHPIQITYRGFPPSDFLSAEIREHADKLERFFSPIIGCRVVVDLPHRHHRQGMHFHVRIELSVPREQLVVARAPDEHSEHEDAHMAVGEAFKAARRLLQDYARRLRGEVKHHGAVSAGWN